MTDKSPSRSTPSLDLDVETAATPTLDVGRDGADKAMRNEDDNAGIPLEAIKIDCSEAEAEVEAKAEAEARGNDKQYESVSVSVASYKFVWGNYTWVLAISIFATIGLSVDTIVWNVAGEAFWDKYLGLVLGYYIVVSIVHAHFFPPSSVPDYRGFLRHIYSLFGAILIYWLHQVLLEAMFDVTLIVLGHSTWISLAFFFGGWDDIAWEGGLSKHWTKNGFFRLLFWWAVLVAAWAIIFIGICSAWTVAAFNHIGLQWFLAFWQWVIMAQLSFALNFKECLMNVAWLYGDGVGGTGPGTGIHWVKRGILLTFIFLLFALICSSIVYAILVVSPAASIPLVAQYSHVLAAATHPLTPSIVFGLYTSQFNSMFPRKDQWLKKFLARFAVVYGIAIVLYFIFHLLWSPLGLTGYKTWFFDQDVAVNFSVSILTLNHEWFTRRWGFLKLRSG